MKLRQYQVDAFANRVFEGNPAAVCILDEWLDEHTMLGIAAENNLAETAFCVVCNGGYQIRWFTPEVEVDLCGHATLATAFVLFSELAVDADVLSFSSSSGQLKVSRQGDWLELDFPAQPPVQCDPPAGLAEALGVAITRCYKNIDYVVVLDSERAVQELAPSHGNLLGLDARGVIVTAKSTEYDFVNRFFAPAVGIDEDPVTGSAFTKLIPFWSQELGKNQLMAKQISKRGGEVKCEMRGDRVKIAGKVVLFSSGDSHF